MAAAGMVGVAFNHRFHEFSDLESAAEDVEAAVSYVRARADQFGLTPNRLGFWAFSRGGPHLSFLLQGRPGFCRCIVAYYALLDLRTDSGFSLLPEDVLKRYSPALHLTPDDPLEIPMFVARRGLDQPEYNEAIDSFMRRALAANAPLEFVNHPKGRHAFDLLDDVPLTHHIRRQTIEFLGSCLDVQETGAVNGGPFR